MSSGGKEQPESSREALVCGIRHTFFQEPCFQSRFVRTIASWFWTPPTRITNCDYMLNHFCLIAKELNPDAKNIEVELEFGGKRLLAEVAAAASISTTSRTSAFPHFSS
jgi:hypothetical protein